MNFRILPPLFGLSLFCVLLAPVLRAQMANEVLLVVNASSPLALEVAHRWRPGQIPSENVLYLSPPESFFRQSSGKDGDENAKQTTRWVVSQKAAREHLLKPIQEFTATRPDLKQAVVVLSPDWPTAVRVDGRPLVSITGFLLYGGALPSGELIKGGRHRWPLYSGPVPASKEELSLIRLFSDPRPAGFPTLYPSMTLAVKDRGQSAEVLSRQLARSFKADFTPPDGTVLFATNSDVRTKARQEQFDPAIARLARLGVKGVKLDDRRSRPRKIAGVMAGKANIPMKPYDGRIQAGAFCEHLTSFGATFQNGSQTKVTRWIEAGAAGSVGTVTEPFSIWTKFPHASVFDRYIAGHTLMESIWASLYSPYQALPIGDPLCRPWGKQAPIRLQTRIDQHVARVDVQAPNGFVGRYWLYVDGSLFSDKLPPWEGIPLTDKRSGNARIQVYAKSISNPTHVGFASTVIEVDPPSILQTSFSETNEHVSWKCDTQDERVQAVRLMRSNQVLGEATFSDDPVTLSVPKATLGSGKQHLKLQATDDEGTLIWTTWIDLATEHP